jgi:hypothetical protein
MVHLKEQAGIDFIFDAIPWAMAIRNIVLEIMAYDKASGKKKLLQKSVTKTRSPGANRKRHCLNQLDNILAINYIPADGWW